MPQVLSEETLARIAKKSSGEATKDASASSAAGGDGDAAAASADAKAPKKVKAPKKPEVKIVIAKIQRQKKKYITAVAGLEVTSTITVYGIHKLVLTWYIFATTSRCQTCALRMRPNSSERSSLLARLSKILRRARRSW